MNPLNNNSPFNGPLTPHNFRQNQTNNAQAEEGAQREAKSSSPTRFAPLVIAGLALLVLPLTIWQINTQQDIRQRASERQQTPVNSTVLAKFDGVDITDTDVDLEYTKQQNATSYLATPSSLKKTVLNDLIELKIIQKEAKARGISVSNEELNYAKSILRNLNSPLSQNAEAVRDLVLRHKLAALLANTLVLNVVISNSNTPQAISFFETIREQALADGSLVAAATPYSKQSRDLTIIENVGLAQDNYLFTPETSELVFSLEPNDLSEVLEDSTRLFIVEVISETLGEYATLEEFLEQEKSTKVQIL